MLLQGTGIVSIIFLLDKGSPIPGAVRTYSKSRILQLEPIPQSKQGAVAPLKQGTKQLTIYPRSSKSAAEPGTEAQSCKSLSSAFPSRPSSLPFSAGHRLMSE